jgi:hypothetical protein
VFRTAGVPPTRPVAPPAQAGTQETRVGAEADQAAAADQAVAVDQAAAAADLGAEAVPELLPEDFFIRLTPARQTSRLS